MSADILFRICEIENNLANVDKSTLVKACKVFMDVENILQRKEPGTFVIVLRWCRLYLDIQTAIDPKNTKLLERYEKTTSTAITYIIGYLQHKPREPKDYHYSLLEILDELLQNLPPNIIQKRCRHFETGTIACLWKPIDVGVDFKTQLYALKIFSTFVKYLDEDKRNGELKVIHKLTNAALCKNELATVLQETERHSLFESASRELLISYNTYVLKNVKGLSFYCNYLTIANKYDVFKLLNSEKFWIDLNYNSQSISFKGRFRLDTSSRYQIVDVTLDVKNIKLERGTMFIHFDKCNIEMFFSLSNENVIQILLPPQEEQRMNRNTHLMKFFKKFKMERVSKDTSNTVNSGKNNEDIFDKLKNGTSLKLHGSAKEIHTNGSITFRESYMNLVDSNYSSTEDVGKTINTSTNSTNSSIIQHDLTATLNETPVSKKTKLFRNIFKHPIRNLRPKRRKLSYADGEDDDYVPNKKSKKEQKKRKTSKVQNQPGHNMKTAVDAVSAENFKNKSNTMPNDSMIVHVTDNLSVGNECAISGPGLNGDQSIMNGVHSIHNNKKSVTVKKSKSSRININSPPSLQSQHHYKTRRKSLYEAIETQNERSKNALLTETWKKCLSGVCNGQKSVQLNSDCSKSQYDHKTPSKSYCQNSCSGNTKANREEIPEKMAAKPLNIGAMIQKTNGIQNALKTVTEPSPRNLSSNSDNIQTQNADCQQVCTPNNSILNISRSVQEKVTIDWTISDVENGSSRETYCEDFPELRSSESRKDDIVTISTPKSMSQTPTSRSFMNISDVYNDSPFMSINYQHQHGSENRNPNVGLNVIQQIMSEWQIDENSVSSIHERVGGDLKGQIDNMESSKRKEHTMSSNQLKQTKDNNKEADLNDLCKYNSEKVMIAKQYDKYCSSKVDENSLTTKVSNMKLRRLKKGKNKKLMLYKSQQTDESIFNVGNGFSSRSSVSTHTEESIIVLSDDSLDSVEETCFSTTYDVLEKSTKLYEKDFSEYNLKIEKCLKDLRHHCLDNGSDINKEKVVEITENIVNESKEQRKDLRQLILNIEKWRGQMEAQCEMYIKRCIQIESLQANAEKLLNALDRNTDIEAAITNECETLINQYFSGIEGDGHKNNYLGSHKKTI